MGFVRFLGWFLTKLEKTQSEHVFVRCCSIQDTTATEVFWFEPMLSMQREPFHKMRKDIFFVRAGVAFFKLPMKQPSNTRHRPVRFTASGLSSISPKFLDYKKLNFKELIFLYKSTVFQMQHRSVCCVCNNFYSWSKPLFHF